MTTELRKFTHPYATMTVATYEPLLLRWVSLIGIGFLATDVARRLPKAKAVGYDGTTPAALALGRTVRRNPPGALDVPGTVSGVPVSVDVSGRPVDPGVVRPVTVPGYPRAVAVGSDVYLHGVTRTDPSLLESRFPTGVRALRRLVGLVPTFVRPLVTVPVTVSNRLGRQQGGFDFRANQATVRQGMVAAAATWAKEPELDLTELMVGAAVLEGVALPHFWPTGVGLHEALSPIGIARYYRQLYFNTEEGVGPIEEAFTVAPLETLEVVHQNVRRQVHEEVLEQGLEIVSEAAVEEKNLDEVSDKVSSMVQNDIGASMSANASGGVGVWQVGATSGADLTSSAERSRDFSVRRLTEVTSRASERITKSFTLRTTDTTDVTDTVITRRLIRNENPAPVSYGLRRVLRRVNVKVQDLGPRLVWQLYVRSPGHGLARSSFVHFREAAPLVAPEVPPGVPPRPTGGTDTGSLAAEIRYDTDVEEYCVTLVIKPGRDRVVTSVRIDGLTDLESGGKDDDAPVPLNEYTTAPTWDTETWTYTVKIVVQMGDGDAVQVAYTYNWDPSQEVLDAWEAVRAAAAAEADEKALTDQFERNKALITMRSRIKPRPANDLRREERYEVMNRMVGDLFGRGDDPSEPTPLEIEQFHRFFDIDAIFVYTHPSWWKPRFSPKSTGEERPSYEISADSEPAPLGSSLGWLIQLDGDRRRNEFLNSPWARVCLPMRSGRERDALRWLRRNLEGSIGYDDDKGPLAELLTAVEATRGAEEQLGVNGPDWVTVDATPGAPENAPTPQLVYPLVAEFDVTVPTDGFVYDELRVVVP